MSTTLVAVMICVVQAGEDAAEDVGVPVGDVSGFCRA